MISNQIFSKNASFGEHCTIGENSTISANRVVLGNHVKIADNVVLKGDEIIIEDNVSIGTGTTAHVQALFLGKQTSIGKHNRFVVSERLAIGPCSNFGNDCTVINRSTEIGSFFHGGNAIDIGGGGRYGPNSILKMGKYGFLGDRCIINTSEPIEIGDDVGIGAEVMLWTHGAYLSAFDGFPADFAPLKIGSHVWIPARSVVLPGVEIGSNVVIGIGSLVNRSIPSGSLAGGIPAKVLRADFYPRPLSLDHKHELMLEIFKDYEPLLIYKGFKAESKTNRDGLAMTIDEIAEIRYSKEPAKLDLKANDSERRIIGLSFGMIPDAPVLTSTSNTTYFDLNELKLYGKRDALSEDLRDNLRRRGVKFFTEEKFASITPKPFISVLHGPSNAE